MNRLEALQALVDGEVIGYLVEEDVYLLQRLNEETLDVEYSFGRDNDPTPLVWEKDDEVILVGSEYETFEIEEESDPNPYKAGTFRWAKFEYKRGNAVTNDVSSDIYELTGGSKWKDYLFLGAEVSTRTWRLA